MDSRYSDLAKLLIEYSCQIEPNDNVLIEQRGMDNTLAVELIKKIYAAGGRPFIHLWNDSLEKAWISGGDNETFRQAGAFDGALMEQMQAYIGIKQTTNLYDMCDVPLEQGRDYQNNYFRPVHIERRIPNTKWVMLRYPSAAMAQLAGMTTEAFADYFFRICNFDYPKLDRAMEPLRLMLEQAKQVSIVGPDVNIRFSVDGIPVQQSAGRLNIPDGEVYTAPVRDTVEGWITYNTPSFYNNRCFRSVHLEFLKGRIVNASCSDGMDTALNALLDTDDGARYIGEFAFGLHPMITSPINDIIIDEKMTGSFHLTPGNSYKETSNGNHSSIHWDLIYNLNQQYGGGEVYFDGKLIQKNGRFVCDSLQDLNPENF